MLIGITLLTQYGDKIFDWVKSLFQGRDALKAVREAQEDFNQTLQDAEIAGEKAQVEASVLYQIATQETRSMEDRTNAAIALQQTYPEYFSQLSTEQIMLGQSKDAYDRLTESLVKQAQARAYLDKITELTAKRIEAEEKVASARARQMQYMNEPNPNAGLAGANTFGGTTGAGAAAMAVLGDDYEKAKKAADQAQSDLSAIDDEIQKIIDRIPVDGLLEAIVEGPRGRTQKPEKIVDDIEAVLENLKYIRKAREEEIGNISDDTARELAMAEYKYATQLEDFREFQRKQAEIQLEIVALTEQRDKEVTIEKRNELTKQINDLKKKWKIDEEGQVAVDNYLIQLEKAFQTERAEILFNAQKAQADYNNKALDEELTLRKLIVENTVENEEERKKAIILATIDIEEQRLQMMLQYEGVYSATQIAIVRETIEKLKREWGKVDEVKGEGKKSFLERLFGDSKTTRRFFNDLRRILKMTADNIKEIINLYKEQAEAAAKAAEEQVKAAEKVYDAELTAYENGYANNVEFARRELDLRKQQHQAALAEAERYQKMQEAVDSATQVSSMITAVANLLANWSAIPYIGQALAVAAIAAMFATFAAAKITAASMVKPVTYGEGMSEYLDYGGSHASGNDIDFGRTKDGRPRRVERGEMIAVFNKRNVDRYGVNTIAGLVDAVNRGTLEREISGSFAGADGEFSINVTKYDDKYIRDISRDLHAIRQGDGRTVTPMPDGSLLVRQGNHTRRIRR